MPCRTVAIPGGGHAIVCGPRPPRKRCSVCGNLGATRQCDWKLKPPPKTCDAWLCERCTHEPAPEKDLCPEHAKAWAQMRAARP